MSALNASSNGYMPLASSSNSNNKMNISSPLRSNRKNTQKNIQNKYTAMYKELSPDAENVQLVTRTLLDAITRPITFDDIMKANTDKGKTLIRRVSDLMQSAQGKYVWFGNLYPTKSWGMYSNYFNSYLEATHEYDKTEFDIDTQAIVMSSSRDKTDDMFKVQVGSKKVCYTLMHVIFRLLRMDMLLFWQGILNGVDYNIQEFVTYMTYRITVRIHHILSILDAMKLRNLTLQSSITNASCLAYNLSPHKEFNMIHQLIQSQLAILNKSKSAYSTYVINDMIDNIKHVEDIIRDIKGEFSNIAPVNTKGGARRHRRTRRHVRK